MTLWDGGWAESQWSTAYGPMELRLLDDGTFDGEYPDHDGRLVGVFRPNERRMLGFWEQSKSEQPCAEARGDTTAWGRFAWTLEGRTRILGAWSYCDAELSGEKTWDGTFVGGVHPLDVEIESDFD